MQAVGTAAAGVLLIVGCTGGQASEEFDFRAPDPPCPPPSALETRQIADERSDILFEPTRTVLAPTLVEGEDDILIMCTYERGPSGSVEDALPEEHVHLSARFILYPQWEDSPSSQSGSYNELPVGSDDLGDWESAADFTRDPNVLREGCGPATPCQHGEEPTVRTYMLHWEFSGHVGNLDFSRVTVTYQVDLLPIDLEADLKPKVVEIFRDFVLAALDSYERVD